MATDRQKQRLEIAISLVRGKVIEVPRDGYDPGNFYQQKVSSLVSSALDIAEQLLVQSEAYDACLESPNELHEGRVKVLDGDDAGRFGKCDYSSTIDDICLVLLDGDDSPTDFHRDNLTNIADDRPAPLAPSSDGVTRV